MTVINHAFGSHISEGGAVVSEISIPAEAMEAATAALEDFRAPSERVPPQQAKEAEAVVLAAFGALGMTMHWTQTVPQMANSSQGIEGRASEPVYRFESSWRPRD